jgi:hypothetical protein
MLIKIGAIILSLGLLCSCVADAGLKIFWEGMERARENQQEKDKDEEEDK